MAGGSQDTGRVETVGASAHGLDLALLEAHAILLQCCFREMQRLDAINRQAPNAGLGEALEKQLERAGELLILIGRPINSAMEPENVILPWGVSVH